MCAKAATVADGKAGVQGDVLAFGDVEDAVRPIGVGGEDADLAAQFGQAGAELIDGVDGASVDEGGIKRWDDVKNSHRRVAEFIRM